MVWGHYKPLFITSHEKNQMCHCALKIQIQSPSHAYKRFRIYEVNLGIFQIEYHGLKMQLRLEVSENVKYIDVTSRASKLPVSKVRLSQDLNSSRLSQFSYATVVDTSVLTKPILCTRPNFTMLFYYTKSQQNLVLKAPIYH